MKMSLNFLVPAKNISEGYFAWLVGRRNESAKDTAVDCALKDLQSHVGRVM